MNKIICALLTSVVVMITSCSDSPESQTSTPAVSTDTVAEVMRPDPVLGEAVFANNCASCHAEGLDRPGTMNLTDKYDAERGPLANRDDLSAEYVKVIVRNGLRLMPAFRPTEITDRQLDDLAAYLSTAKPLSATSSAATP